MTERIRRYVLWALSVSLSFSAVRNWFTTLRDLRRFYTNIQIWDAFDWVARYERYRHFDLSVFWIQHNEHREIGTEILFAIDMLLFHGRQILPTAAGVAAYLGVLVIFTAFALYQAEDFWSSGCAALLVASLAGYRMCVVSLTIPFLTSWPQWEFFGVAALATIALHKRRGGKVLLILSLACAVAATYSMSNGMLVWPLLLAVALLLRFKILDTVAVLLVGAVASGAYFYHYGNMHSLALGTEVSHPLYLLGFLGSFLGMPFSAADGFTNQLRSNSFGWIALTIMLADFGWIVRKRLFAAPVVIVMGGFSLLVLASAGLTAAGRMDVKDPYYQAARAGRYITEPTLFWCALVMLSVWLLGKAWHGYAPLLFLLALTILSATTLPRTRGFYSWWENYFAKGQWAAIAVANGVVDSEVSDILFPSREFVAQYLHVLPDNHLAMFADAQPGWIGLRASDLFERGPDGWIHGEVTTVKRRGPDYEVQGWADGSTTLVFTDDTDRIVGFGLRPKAGPPELYTHDVPWSMAYTGFIRGEFAAKAFSVWALDRKDQKMWRMGRLRNELPK